MHKLTPLILFILLATTSHAQFIRRYHAHKGQLPPKAILVRLATANNQVKFYKEHNDTKNIALLAADAEAQRAAMVADFKDHFTYCPVYFFYDTAQAAVQAKNFSVLLNSDMKPVANVNISPSDTNYFIVYYGYQEGDDLHDYSGNSVKTLIALNYDFTPLAHNLPWKSGASGTLTAKKGVILATYKFKSKNFDISYEPYAGTYNHMLTTFYRER